MQKYLWDKKDKIILSVLCNHARLSYNQIAKLTHISKDSVRSRILRMQKDKVIHSYFALINYDKLGIKLINVYCKLKSTRYVREDKIKPILNCPYVSAITWLMGEFDLELQIMAKNKKEIRGILKKIGFLENIQEYKISIAGKPEIYSTNWISAKLPGGEKARKIEERLDKKDIDLIDSLCKNARDRIIDLAEKLNLKEDEVRYRIKRLVEKGIVMGFHARTGKSSMGDSRYLTLIKIKHKLSQKEIENIKNMSNVFYLKSGDGYWNYFLRFHTSSNKELVTTIGNLKDLFSENLIDLKVHTILEIMKFNPSPAAVMKKNLKFSD